MDSNKMASASNLGQRRQLSIPSRSSSIAQASGTCADDTHRMTARYNLVEDNSDRVSFLHNNPNPPSMRSASSRPISRTQSPARVDRRSISHAPSSRISDPPSKVQRWAGLTRSVCDWDGLRKDPELWVQDGECAVHLYARGASRRGPSFCVPLRALRQKRCGAMLDICHAQTTIELPDGSRESRRLYRFDDLNREVPLVVELYIPASETASREESFNWHLATRNFFAFILGKPLVGRQMGQTFVDLFERMELFRSGVDNRRDFLDYAENQGYRDLVECTDYALASLYYAERYKLRDIWIDAFAHCVGMEDSLPLSPEYMAISRLSKALITRAHLEVDMRLDRIARALRYFLEEDFSPAYLGLTAGARTHLRSFQGFLHQFYIKKFGYWPPPRTFSFPKVLYKSMYYDFKSLYDLLADTRSKADITSQTPASGGICVLQTVDHFDTRHKFNALPHSLPLLPAVSGETATRSLSSVSYKKKTRDLQPRLAALDAATNDLDTSTEIIQAYKDFEKAYASNLNQREEKITAVDARKVRWLLVYGTLQYLNSALRAPNGVRDAETPDYPLCCLVAGQSSWNMATPISTSSAASGISPLRDDHLSGAQGSPTIQPDCHREDYFAPTMNRRETSTSAKTNNPSRQPSTRSFGPLHSLSTRTSRRNSVALRPTAHCPIIIRGYGDGLNQTTTPPSDPYSTNAWDNLGAQEKSLIEDSWLNPRPLPTPNTATNAASGLTRARTPLLHTIQLDHTLQHADADADADDLNETMSRSDSTGSKGSSVWSDEGSAASSKSSADGGHRHSYKASAAEHSGLLGGLVSVDGTRVSLEMPAERTRRPIASQRDIHPLFRHSMVEQGDHGFDFVGHRRQGAVSFDAAGSIGMAFSASPFPPPCIVSPVEAPTAYRTMSLTSQEMPSISASNELKPVTILDAAARKKSRSSDILSGILSSPTELRDRYNHVIKRFEPSGHNTLQPGSPYHGAMSHAQPPTVTKTSHAAKTPTLRSRIWHDDAKDGKKGKRLSSFWRR